MFHRFHTVVIDIPPVGAPVGGLSLPEALMSQQSNVRKQKDALFRYFVEFVRMLLISSTTLTTKHFNTKHSVCTH